MKSKLTVILLILFLGSLGIHNFYLNETEKGLIQLFLNIIGWATIWVVFGGFVLAILWTWLFVEFILFLVMNDNEFNSKYNKIEKS